MFFRVGSDGPVALCGRDHSHHCPHEFACDITVSPANLCGHWMWFRPHAAAGPSDPTSVKTIAELLYDIFSFIILDALVHRREMDVKVHISF